MGLCTLEPVIAVFFIVVDNSHEWRKSKGKHKKLFFRTSSIGAGYF